MEEYRDQDAVNVKLALENASKFFGINTIKDFQLEAATAALLGKKMMGNELAVPGFIIVKSQLMALMKDQMQRLTDTVKESGKKLEKARQDAYLEMFNAVSLGGKKGNLSILKHAKFAFLYCSPESILSTPLKDVRTPWFQERLLAVVIDESHCIIKWSISASLQDLLKILEFCSLFLFYIDVMGKCDHCAVWGCDNDRRYPDKYDGPSQPKRRLLDRSAFFNPTHSEVTPVDDSETVEIDSFHMSEVIAEANADNHSVHESVDIPQSGLDTSKESHAHRLSWDSISGNSPSIKLYTGCPTAKIFLSIVDRVRSKHGKISYFKGKDSFQVKNYQYSPSKPLSRKSTGPSRQLKLEDDILLTLMRIRLDPPIEDPPFILFNSAADRCNFNAA
eukprot:gene21260-23334_t